MEQTPTNAAKKRYWIDPMKCVGCSKCARSCPARAIDAALIIDDELCVGCGICDRYCWFGAVEVRTDGHVSDYHVHRHPHRTELSAQSGEALPQEAAKDPAAPTEEK